MRLSDGEQDVFEGVVFKVDSDQPLLPSVTRICELSESLNRPLTICAKLPHRFRGGTGN